MWEVVCREVGCGRWCWEVVLGGWSAGGGVGRWEAQKVAKDAINSGQPCLAFFGPIKKKKIISCQNLKLNLTLGKPDFDITCLWLNIEKFDPNVKRYRL